MAVSFTFLIYPNHLSYFTFSPRRALPGSRTRRALPRSRGLKDTSPHGRIGYVAACVRAVYTTWIVVLPLVVLVFFVALVEQRGHCSLALVGQASVDPHSEPFPDCILFPDVPSCNTFSNTTQVACGAGLSGFPEHEPVACAITLLLEVEQNSALFVKGQLKVLTKILNTGFTGACSSVTGLSWTGGLASSWISRCLAHVLPLTRKWKSAQFCVVRSFGQPGTGQALFLNKVNFLGAFAVAAGVAAGVASVDFLGTPCLLRLCLQSVLELVHTLSHLSHG